MAPGRRAGDSPDILARVGARRAERGRESPDRPVHPSRHADLTQIEAMRFEVSDVSAARRMEDRRSNRDRAGPLIRITPMQASRARWRLPRSCLGQTWARTGAQSRGEITT